MGVTGKLCVKAPWSLRNTEHSSLIYVVSEAPGQPQRITIPIQTTDIASARYRLHCVNARKLK